MPEDPARRFFGLRLNWIVSGVLTGLLCSFIGVLLAFAGGYEMERTKSLNWAVIVGYLLLLPTMLVGYVVEYFKIPDDASTPATPIIIAIQLSWYVFLFWVFRKVRRSFTSIPSLIRLNPKKGRVTGEMRNPYAYFINTAGPGERDSSEGDAESGESGGGGDEVR